MAEMGMVQAERQEPQYQAAKVEPTGSGHPLAQVVSNSPQHRRLHQLKAIANPSSVVQRQPAPQGGLPASLKSGIESLSGIAMDDVRVHYNSPKPAQLQAHAFAQGTDIHLASGQERHLPHEAWHVVQQKQGRVKPTLQMKGVAINDDDGLEREADVMGGRALQLQRREPLQPLEDLSIGASGIQRQVVQRGAKGSKPDESVILEDSHAGYVAEAINKLTPAIGTRLAFGASPQVKFDEAYWEAVQDPEYGLSLRCKGKPSAAILAIMEHRDKWSFDCAEFVQVCNLYAMVKMGDEEEVDQMQPFELRQHNSTGLNQKGVFFKREASDGRFDAIFPAKGNNYLEGLLDEDGLVNNLPVGARVCFKNPAAPDTPYRNENSIVTGKNQYSAHPLGNNLSAAAIIDHLVAFNQSKGLGGDDNGRSQIFVSEVEIYDTIMMSNTRMESLKLLRYKDAGYF